MQQWNTNHADAFVGQIIKVDGKNYRVTKVTCTALAVERWYWFDAAYALVVRKVKSWMA